MAVTYAADTETDRMDAVKDQIDAGTGAGKIEIGTAAMAATLVTITLNDPSGTTTGDVLTFSGFPKSGTAGGTGTAAAARVRDSDDNDVVTGLTVSTSGADINLDSVSITSGQDVELTSATLTHA